MALRVLIVDDSTVSRKIVSRTLSLGNLEIDELLEAPDGAKALALLEKEPIDLALVDLNMPIMNGEEFILRAKENPALKTVRFIVVSTERSEARIQRLETIGVRSIQKPISPERLLTVINETMGNDSTQGQWSEFLHQVSSEILAETCFLFPTDHSHEEPPLGVEKVVAVIGFHGHFTGRFETRIDADMLQPIAENMLGVDDHLTAEILFDALGELTNVLCGAFLPRIAGSRAVFSLDPPKVASDPLEDESGQNPPDAEAELNYAEGQAAIRFYVS